MADNHAEAALLEQAGKGNEAAFLVLYERHRDCIYRFAYRLLGSAALAEDVTHDCFMALLNKPRLFNPQQASLRTYLCAAARNQAYKQLRRQGREDPAEDDPTEPLLDQRAGPYEALCASEMAQRVRQAVMSLPLLQREAVVLFEYEELSLAEIAAIAECDIGTVKARLHRARQRLRVLLQGCQAAQAKETMVEKCL